jgi:hypothetical protein
MCCCRHSISVWWSCSGTNRRLILPTATLGITLNRVGPKR